LKLKGIDVILGMD
jgi:hypothetical protein